MGRNIDRSRSPVCRGENTFARKKRQELRANCREVAGCLIDFSAPNIRFSKPKFLTSLAIIGANEEEILIWQ